MSETEITVNNTLCSDSGLREFEARWLESLSSLTQMGKQGQVTSFICFIIYSTWVIFVKGIRADES